MANYQIYFRLNGGIWNNDVSADPVTNTGGIDLSAMEGTTLYPTVQGVSNVGITANFGASPFVFAVPSGYTAGWPAVFTPGFTTFNAGRVYGSAFLSGGDLTVNFPSSAGMAQALDGYFTGKFYFELSNPTGDGTSVSWGGGVGTDYALGGDFNEWFNGKFTSGDPNGGALLSGQSLAHELSSIIARGSVIKPDVFNFALGSGDVLGIAVFLTGVSSATASVGDVIFRPANEFFDLSSVTNRRKLINADGCTVNLGPDGAAPFGAAPAVFLTIPPGGTAPNAFAANFGFGGGFALTGGNLAFSLTIPCCSTTVTELSADRPSAANPQVMLSVSDDGSRTWSPLQKWRSMGRIGEYLKRLRWLKMGQFRQRIIKLEITDPVRRNIVGFYEDVSEGME